MVNMLSTGGTHAKDFQKMDDRVAHWHSMAHLASIRTWSLEVPTEDVPSMLIISPCCHRRIHKIQAVSPAGSLRQEHGVQLREAGTRLFLKKPLGTIGGRCGIVHSVLIKDGKTILKKWQMVRNQPPRFFKDQDMSGIIGPLADCGGCSAWSKGGIQSSGRCRWHPMTGAMRTSPFSSAPLLVSYPIFI